MAAHAAPPLKLRPRHKAALENLTKRSTTAQQVARRARVLLDAAEGVPNVEIARRHSLSRVAVTALRARFGEKKMAALEDAPRSGRPPKIGPEKVKQIVSTVMHEKPKHATHWTRRSLAEKFHVSPATVDRILRDHRLKPELVEHFKFSNDPDFVEKVRDIVGLYLKPPRKALVFSVDEKSQIQALERTAPILPIQGGIPERQSHDYWRNGTTTLFAALNVLDGSVIGKCLPRHRNEEFVDFLNHIDTKVPKHLDVHLIMDNYATHKHANVKAWLAQHPRYHVHFTPTSSSWLNLVERFFAEITGRRIRRGSFGSVRELVKAINAYIADRNRDPKAFVWKATANKILRRISKCKSIYETGH
ncbi:MAG: IS630 family transposase [Candidatus Baltobacteraceae bacterium]